MMPNRISWFLKIVAVVAPSVLALAVALSQQNASPPAQPSDASQVRDEIQTIEKLLSQLPDRGPALFQLAHDYVYIGELSKGLSVLKECVALKEGFDPDGDPTFLPLNRNPEFVSLLTEVHKENPQVQHARLAFTVPQKDLIPEGLATDSRRHIFYMGSLNLGKIVKFTTSGPVANFVDANEYKLHSVCGMKVDSSGDVWANTCPYNGIGSELVHVDEHGRMLEQFSSPEPGPHLFNDLVLRKSEEIYLTDSLANRVFRFDRKTRSFSALTFPRHLYYPNGIALSDDGEWLYVSDAFGTLQYNLRNQKGHEVDPGPSRTLSGFDGLYWYRDGLIGIQNSLGSARVVQCRLSGDGLRLADMFILENRSDFVSSPTTGALDGSRFYFMANTHIDDWKDGKIIDEKQLEPVRIGVVDLH
jgi:sugar lactone lactonase YvrE